MRVWTKNSEHSMALIILHMILTCKVKHGLSSERWAREPATKKESVTLLFVGRTKTITSHNLVYLQEQVSQMTV